MIHLLVLIVICLLLSAFFSGMEIAFVSSNKFRIEIEKNKKSVSQTLIDLFVEKSNMYITTLLIGNNAVLVIYGIYMTDFLELYVVDTNSFSVGVLLLLETFISTGIILIFAEFLPKILFRLRANFFLRVFSVPVFLFYLLFFPISTFAMWLSGVFIRLFTKKRLEETEKENVFGKVDLSNLIEENKVDQSNKEEVHEIKLFKNALDFSEVRLRDCIVPRTDLVALSIDTGLEELSVLFVKSGMSRILIYRDTIDNIIGYVHVSALFHNPESISKIITRVIIVPETMSASHLLNQFIKEHRSLAVVVDEFGVTAGIVTIEDIMEEIFGEIEDEHDHQTLVEKKISDHEYVFSGRLSVDYINEKYNLGLKESEEYETLAGYILYYNENIPTERETILIENINFEILKLQNTRLEIVKVSL